MYVTDKTPSLFKIFFHLGTGLDFENRWLKLSESIPWEKLDELYGVSFSSNAGRPAVDSRLVCGLFLVKYIKNISDEEAVSEYEENPYIQAFCGREYFAQGGNLSRTILSERRKRLGAGFFEYFEKEVLPAVDRQKFVRVRTQEEKNDGVFTRMLEKIKSFFG